MERRENILLQVSALPTGHDKTFYALLIWDRTVLETIMRCGAVSFKERVKSVMMSWDFSDRKSFDTLRFLIFLPSNRVKHNTSCI